jgi:hypothetical protein
MNSSNNNSEILGPSLSQGQVFRKQQQSRILNNNDVVTGNAVRNKNKPNKNKNRRTNISALSIRIIEPFSQNTDSINTKYKPLTLQDMERSNSVIKSVNDIENTKTQQSASSYLSLSNNLNTFQQGVTDQAKTYNTINTTPGLLNKNYLTADNKNIRVNNKGVINTLNPSSLKKDPQSAPGISISASTANSIPDTNYTPVENIPEGLTKGSSAGLYDKQTSSTQLNLPSRVSAYNLEGENIRVLYPYPNGVDAIKENMSYIGAFTSDGVLGISIDSTMPVETTLNCLQRAVDKGYSWCGMLRYSYSNNSQGGGGTCAIGNVTNISKNAYKLMSISQTGWTSTLKFPAAYTSLTFGADGVLYAGYNSFNFAYRFTPIFNNDLDPTYGGTINNLVASYAYNQGYWDNLKTFDGNYDPTGQSSATMNTIYQYNVQVPNIGYYQQTYPTWWGQTTINVPYVYYTTQTAQKLAAPNTSYGNLVYINYNCGKVPTKVPIVKGQVNAGEGFNITCTELYNKYPSFSLELTDTGVLTITNNTSSSEISESSKKVTYDMSYGYPQTIKLANGQEVTLNMPRSEWVSGSINGGRAIVSSSRNTHSMGLGQWISSPNGFCRLILSDGTLTLEYSLQDVSQDKDGNLVGNGLSVALYNIRNVNTTGLGTSAHVDINGGLNPYPINMVQYDNTYTELKGYIPKTASSSFSANESDCRNACNNNPACTGYVIYGNCNLLTYENTFPIGDRLPASQVSTYVRNTKYPYNDKSCRKTLDAIVDADAYSYYLNNGILSNTMTPQTKCNLGKVLNSQMNQLKQRNDAAVQKGQEIKNQFNDIFSRENKVLDSISNNRKTSQNYDKTTKNVVKEIDRIKNSQITKSASEKDSELLLVSDNYKYVIWGIISLLISMATIKGLRMASS